MEENRQMSLTIDGVTYSGTVSKDRFGLFEWVLKLDDGRQIHMNNTVFNEDGTLKSGTATVKTKEWAPICEYEGEFLGEQPSGKGKMTYYKDGPPSIYDGEWQGGKRHGYGKFTKANGDIEEGEFLNGQPQRTFIKYAESGLNYYLTYNSEEKITSYQLLPEDPGREDKKIKIPDSTEMDKPSNWLYKATISYSDPESTEHQSEVIYECRSYEGDGSRKAEVKILPNRINELLSGEATKSLEELLNQGAIIITSEVGSKEEPQKVTDPGKAREILKAALEEPIKLRAAGEAAGFGGGTALEAQIMMLSMIGDEDLKNIRLCTEKVSYTSMTSFLESIGMDKESLNKSGEDYITVWALTDAQNHAVCLIVDLKKIREALKKGGDWDSLNTSKETFIHCFDSSRVVGSKNYKGSFGAITENLDAINWNLQKEGTCWFHGLAAVMVALENPDVVGKILDGRIPGYGPGKHEHLEDSDVPNEFMLKHVLELRKIESILGISLGEGGLLVEGIVSNDFKDRMTELAKSEELLEELDKRIKEAFNTFEEKLKKLGSEVPELLDTEYEDYKKKTTKEYGKNLITKATPPATDNAKEVPEFLEGSEKLLVMWEQLYDLESRLKAGLEKFKEERGKIVEQTEKKKTEKLNIVTILKNSAKALDKETGSSTIPPPTSLPSNLTCFEGAEMSSPDNGTQPTVKTPEGKAAVAPPTSLLPSPPDLVVALGGAKTSPMEDTQPPSSQSELPVSADTRTNVNETIQVGGK